MHSATEMQSSIKSKVIISLLLVIFALLAAFNAYEYRVHRTDFIWELEARGDQITARLAINLIVPLWEIDDDWVTKIIDSEMIDENVYAIVVRGEGQLLEGKKRDRHWHPVETSETIIGDFISHSKDVVRNQEIIGTVTIYMTKQFMENRLRQEAMYAILTTLLLGLFLILFLILRLNKIIIQPLQDVLATAKFIAKGDYKHDITIQQRDEIGLLADEINRMKKNISLREEQLRLLLDSTVEGIYGINSEGTCIFCNPSSLRFLGYEKEDDLVGKNIHSLIHHTRADGSSCPFHECTTQKAMQQKIAVHGEDDILWKADGTSFPVEHWAHPIMKEGSVIGAVVTFFDISDRQQAKTDKDRLERQLRQAQKMESIGTLAGGIAHDFNNILTPIIGYADMVQEELPSGSQAWENQGAIIAAGMRARNLVQQILTFSRQTEHENKPLQIHLIIKEALKLLRSSIPTTIEIRQDIDSQCGFILADPSQIHQVIMNLCTNAYQAMREKGGVLGVALSEVELHPEDYLTHLHLAPGIYLKIEISDTGHGIPPEIQEKIFEPYYTTKAKGEGTGMGLATVHGIVQSHNGHITVYSEPGRGTTFHIYFPKVQKQERQLETTTKTGPPAEQSISCW